MFILALWTAKYGTWSAGDNGFGTVLAKLNRVFTVRQHKAEHYLSGFIVHVPDKPSGHRRQKSEMVWNFIGKVNLPGDDQTVERQRKGRTA